MWLLRAVKTVLKCTVPQQLPSYGCAPGQHPPDHAALVGIVHAKRCFPVSSPGFSVLWKTYGKLFSGILPEGVAKSQLFILLTCQVFALSVF